MWKPATAAGMGAAALMWAVLAPAPAAAGPDLGAAFERFDADRNGSVTPEEFRRGHADDRFVVLGRNEPKLAAPMMIPLARGHRPDAAHRPVPAHILGQEFARQDADRDGAVTFPEFEAFHRAMMQQAFGNLDRNRDGGIDRDELARIVKTLPAGAPKPDFTAIDKDGNGALSSDEFFDHGG